MPNRALTVYLLIALFVSAYQKTYQTAQPLPASEQALVEGSKRAIIQTGLSPEYFETHFKVIRVIDKPADRRVLWQFSINEYVAIVTDSIGSYLDGTKRMDTHSIANALGHTSEIRRTISRVRALKIMKKCIGDFDNPAVEYGPVDGYAQLLLVAHARTSVNERRSRETERERKEAAKRVNSATDVIESEEGDDRPATRLGSVNLQTGKCTKGSGLIAP